MAAVVALETFLLLFDSWLFREVDFPFLNYWRILEYLAVEGLLLPVYIITYAVLVVFGPPW